MGKVQNAVYKYDRAHKKGKTGHFYCSDYYEIIAMKSGLFERIYIAEKYAYVKGYNKAIRERRIQKMNIKSALNHYTKTIRYGNGNKLMFSLEDYLDILEHEITSSAPDTTEEDLLFRVSKLSYIAGLYRGMKAATNKSSR